MADLSIPDIPALEGTGVRLRPWTHDDVDAVIAAGRDSFIPVITTVPVGCDEAQAHEFVERQIGRPETDHGHARVIADRETDEAIGHLYTSLIFVRVGRAEMGYWVLPDKRTRGAASEALDLAATWVLANTEVRRVTLQHRAVERRVDRRRATGRLPGGRAAARLGNLRRRRATRHAGVRATARRSMSGRRRPALRVGAQRLIVTASAVSRPGPPRAPRPVHPCCRARPAHRRGRRATPSAGGASSRRRHCSSRPCCSAA